MDNIPKVTTMTVEISYMSCLHSTSKLFYFDHHNLGNRYYSFHNLIEWANSRNGCSRFKSTRLCLLVGSVCGLRFVVIVHFLTKYSTPNLKTFSQNQMWLIYKVYFSTKLKFWPLKSDQI